MMGRPAKDTTVFGQFEYENPGLEYARVPIYGNQFACVQRLILRISEIYRHFIIKKAIIGKN